MRGYLEVWRLPSARTLTLAGIVGRLPVGIVPLALLLVVQARTGSYAVAGVTLGVYTVATAAVAPLLGRVADRRGPRPVLLATGVGYPVLLLLLVAVVEAGASEWPIYLAAAAAGAAFPLLSSSLRALWNDLADGPVRQTAYALESIAMEVVWILGPLLVALAVAVASPVVALAGSAGVALVGTLTVALSAPARACRPRAAAEGASPRVGPLRAPGMVLLLVAVASLMFGIGVMEVGVPAFADAEGDRALSGVLLGVWGVGSVVGGVWFGTRRFAAPLLVQYRWAVLAIAVGMAPLSLAGSTWLLGAVLVAGGAALAPAMTVQNGLIADLAPVGSVTEAFTWLTTVGFGSMALGSATGGAVVELPAGVTLAFLLAAVSAFVAWSIVAWPRTALARRPGALPARRPEPATR